jgi:hypothetical protein
VLRRIAVIGGLLFGGRVRLVFPPLAGWRAAPSVTYTIGSKY